MPVPWTQPEGTVRADLLELAGLDDSNPASPELLRYLATQPVMGVNVHAEPQGMRQAYIDQQAIEPLAFGSMGDPVSQLAFLGAPGLLRASKGTLEALATPGPRYGGMLTGEGGGVGLRGPQPWPRGEPLPPYEPFVEESLKPTVRAGRGAGVLGHTGEEGFRRFQGRAPELLEGLPYAKKLTTYKNAVDVFKRQKGLSPEGLPSSKDLLELFEMGKDTGDWYTQARQTLWNIFGEDGDLMANLIGATSPQVRVSRNLDLALTAYQRHKMGLDPVPPDLMSTNAENVYRAIRGEPLSGPKVSRFAANILGDKTPVTVDVWMMRLFGLNPEQAPTPQQYRMISEWTTQLAKDIGVTPSEMQAALWVGGKMAHGPLPGEAAETIPLPLGELIEKKVLGLQPQMEKLTGALGHYFSDLAPEARQRLLKTVALASTLAPALKGANMSEEEGTAGKVLRALGVKSPNANEQAQIEELLRDTPGFGE